MKWTEIKKSLRETTAPLAALISTGDGRDWLRRKETIEDTIVDNLIDAARLQIEKDTGRALVHTEYRVVFDQFASERAIVLPRIPLVSITHVKSYDKNDAAATMASAGYLVDTEQGRIALNSDINWPTDLREFSGGEIQFLAGYGATASDVPQDLIHAAEQLLAHWFDPARDPIVIGTSVTETILGYHRAIFPYRDAFLG